MLCSEIQLVKSGDGFEDIKPLPCNRWSCAHCARRRKRRLIVQAASGEPNKMLTLTVNSFVGTDPNNRRNMLHDAWKRLVKRILRQFALPPARRWSLTTGERTARREAITRAITNRTQQKECEQIHYFAFLERTKLGEPHLHILLRCPYIPQDWISEQMADMIGSPICDIRQIHNTKMAIYYVTKYVTKAPAQFGSGKRYWISKRWLVNDAPKPEREKLDRKFVGVVRRTWCDEQQRRIQRGWTFEEIEDGWVRWRAPNRARSPRYRFSVFGQFYSV